LFSGGVSSKFSRITILVQLDLTKPTSCCHHLSSVYKVFSFNTPEHLFIYSESLGLVPMWGEAPDDVTADIHKLLHLASDQVDLLYGAYREDNPNGT